MSPFRKILKDAREAVQQTTQGKNVVFDPDLNRFQRLVQRNVRLFFLVARLDVLNKLKFHAQALTYDTLLALVPLLAVVFSIFKSLGGIDNIRIQLEAMIVDNLSGSPELRDQLSVYLDQFITNIHAGKLGAISIVILVWSVLSLLGHIEFAFNGIYGTPTTRPWLLRILTYWGVLIFGPLLLAASFALTAALQNSWFANTVENMGGLGSLSVHLSPLVVTWLALTIMYIAVPNTRVRLRSAATAALITGVLWTFAKYGYAIYVKHNLTVQNIYGSVATIPLFILWLYVSWLLVLFGAQLAFAFQNSKTYEYEKPGREDSQRTIDFAACAIMTEVSRSFLFAKGPAYPEVISSQWGIPRRLLETIITRLKEGHFIQTVDRDTGLLSARNIQDISVGSVLFFLRQGKGDQPNFRSDESKSYVGNLLETLQFNLKESPADLNFENIATEVEKRAQETESNPATA